MMSPATTGKPSGKDEAQITSTARKPSSSATRPQEPPIKCPRCDSPNTKFCYYNNYSLTQPRHFCKTCRRYWTKGGALRNVPIGGGCRKNKKMKSSPRLPGDSKDSGGSSSDIGGLKFFQGLSPAMDFQLNNIPRQLHTSNTTAGFFNQFSSYGDTSSPANFNLEGSGISTPLLGFTFPLSSATLKQGDNSNTTTIPLGFQEMGNLASSIESLSSINQDLHWRLQQQRLANLFVNDKEENSMNIPSELQLIQKPHPILFHHLDNNSKTQSFLGGSSRKDAGLSTAELFFDHSYEAEPAQATGGSNNLNDNATNWSGISQTWTELSNFTSLP